MEVIENLKNWSESGKIKEFKGSLMICPNFQALRGIKMVLGDKCTPSFSLKCVILKNESYLSASFL